MVDSTTPIERLQLRLEVQLDALQKGMRQLQGITSRSLKASERQFSEFERNVARSGSRAADGFTRAFAEIQRANIREILSGVAIFLSAERVVAYADAWAQVTNRLKAAGVAAGDQERILKNIYAIAQENGLAIDDLATLYSRTAQAASELGATQAQLEQVTSGVAAAIRINGSSIESARGALVQFAQALGSGTVRAEEFNSIQEGARPILQVVANNLDKTGGSVNRLKLLVNEGQITSEEFFQAFLKGSQGLVNQAGELDLTIGQSFVKLENAFAKFVGALNVSGTLAAPIELLADNLDELLKIALTLGVAFATYNAVVAVASTRTAVLTAALGLQTLAHAALTTATTGSTGALTRLFLLMSAHPIGLIVTALAAATTALYLFSDGADSARNAVNKTIDRIVELQNGFDGLSTKTAEQTEEQDDLNFALKIAEEAAKDVTKRTMELTGALAQQAIFTLEAEAATRRLALAEQQRFKAGVSAAATGASAFSGVASGLLGLAGVVAGPTLDAGIAAEERRITGLTTAIAKLKEVAASGPGVPALAEDDPDTPQPPARPSRTRRSGGGGGRSNRDRVGDLLSGAREKIAALQTETVALGMAKDAAEAYRFQEELIARARQQGIALTPQLAAQIAELTRQYGAAAAGLEKVKLAAKEDEFLSDVQKRVAALSVENEALKLTGEEQIRFVEYRRLLNEATEQGLPLTAEFVKNLEAQADALAKGASKLQEGKDRVAQFEDGMRTLQETAADVAERLIINFESVGDVLRDVVKLLASSALRNLITGERGGLAGGLDSLLGAEIFGRASGGPVNAGQLYRVNELAGQKEYFMPNVNGRIGNRAQGSGGPMTVVVDLRGNITQPGLERQLRQAAATGAALAITQSRRNLPSEIAQLNARQ